MATTAPTLSKYELGEPEPRASVEPGTQAEPRRSYDDDPDDGDEQAGLLNQEKVMRRARAGSMLSFDLSNRLLLQASEEVGEPSSAGTSLRKPNESVSLTAGIALIVGLTIGSGIFASSGIVARETGSVGAALVVWVFAGFLSWAGGSSLAELGTALPMNGGAQAYLSAAYGPLPSYCFSFTAVTALKPGSQAIISIIGAEYICRILWHTAFSSDPRAAARGVPTLAIKGVAIICLVLVSALQAWSTKAGTRAQIVVTAFKVIAIVVIFIGGIVWLGLGRVASDFAFDGEPSATGLALALFSALWAYDGFDQANYVARDCKPGALPKMINISLALIVVLFVLANVAYCIVLPFNVVSATSTIGLDFGRAIGGAIGAVIFALIVGISCIGALNSSLYTSSRLVVAAGEQGFLPKVFSEFNSRRQTPINGLILSSSLSIVFILLGDFSNLTLFYGVTAWFWNLCVVVGLLVLRVREPTLKRPYRTWLSTPILFASTALFLLVLSCFSKPWQSLAAFMFCGAGTVPYYFQVRRNRGIEREATEGLEMT
ncbi:hypothetical protein JCM10212_001945 [Sporobolomyces blumeae]